MAELSTIARPYAEAAFALARDRNELPVWSEMLRLLTQVVGDARVAGALDHPKLTAGDKEALLLSVAGDAPDAWRFTSVHVRRARAMRRIERDFDAVPELAALVADLIEEIEALRARLR